MITDITKAYDRIRNVAAAQGFGEIPDRHEVAGVWQLAHARWCMLRKKAAASGSLRHSGGT